MQACADYLEEGWHHLHFDPYFSSLGLAEVRRASSTLEATYTVRLFSVFEAILRDFLPLRHPAQVDRRSVHDLINRTASRLHIPANIRDGAHQVREFRNQAVHQNQTLPSRLTFADAVAFLNRFLAWLP